MSKIKITFTAIIVIILLILLLFGTGILNLQYFKFFAPKMEDARRDVFENTQSYVHGMQQQLGKYYREWQKADTLDEKEAIEAVVNMQFAEFDETKIDNYKLQKFLTKTRGY